MSLGEQISKNKDLIAGEAWNSTCISAKTHHEEGGRHLNCYIKEVAFKFFDNFRKLQYLWIEMER